MIRLSEFGERQQQMLVHDIICLDACDSEYQLRYIVEHRLKSQTNLELNAVAPRSIKEWKKAREI